MRKQHTMIWKRLLAFALALSMLASWLPQQAAAQEAEVVTDTGDVVVEGTNGLGGLLSQRITEAQAEAENAQAQGGCVITDLTVQGNTASVEFVTDREALLVVAIYDENQQKLLCSGKTRVGPEDTSAQVAIEGAMDTYFRVKAFLADSYDLTPLCQAYETPMYTQAMQELLDSSAADYDQDRVLQLEAEEKDTNFLVYSEDTLRIQEEEGINTVVSADYENQVYVFGNADEQITGLGTGDIFSYEYGDGEMLIVKVASIQVEEDGTATVTGGELALEDVFDYIKIEASANTNEADVTVPEDGSFSYLGSQEQPLLYADGETDAPDVIQHRFGIQYPKEDYMPDWNQATEFSISGSLTLSGTGGFDLYQTNGTDFLQLNLDMDFGFNLNVTGAARLPTEPMPTLRVHLLPGVTLYLQPTLELTFSGSVDFWATAEWDMGFLWEVGTKNATNIGTPLRIRPLMEANVTVFIGLDLRPMVSLVNKHIFNVEVNVPVGLEVEVKTTGTDFDETLAGSTDHAKERHSCGKCLDISGSLLLRINVTVEFCDRKLGKGSATINVPLWSFKAYLSLTHGSFAFTECPYKEYRISIQVLDPENRGADNAAVKIGQTVYYTDENGLVNVYLTPGYRVVRIAHGELVKDTTLDVTGAGKAIFRLGATGSGPEFIFGAIEDGTLEDEDIRDHGEITYSGKCGNNATWTLYKDGHMAVRGNGAMNQYLWSMYKEDVKSLSIESGITSLYPEAFKNCTNLKKVTIANTVTNIDSQAFYGCTALTGIKIPDSVTMIGENAFGGCSGLISLDLGEGPKTISSGAFSGCTGLATLTVPKGITWDGSYAFSSCTGLVELTLEEGLTAIGARAFSGCTGLRMVQLPDSLTKIWDYAFLNCSNLVEVRFGKDLKTIGNNAFEYCRSLRILAFPENLAEIGEYAFGFCEALPALEFPDSLTTIGSNAFTHCYAIKDVTFGAGPVNVGYNAFSGCAGLENVYSPSLEAWLSMDFYYDASQSSPDGSSPMQYAEHLYLGGAEPVDVVVPQGTERIAPFAFYNCNTLRTVSLPQSVTSLGAYAFYGCTSLSRIHLPDRIPEIGPFTFYSCTKLTQIRIPEGVSAIGQSAFAYSGLQAVRIPDSVQTIASEAFYYSNSLSAVIVGSAVTSIGWYAFYGNDALSMVIFRGDAPQMDATAFKKYAYSTSPNHFPAGYYPAGNETWTEALPGYSCQLAWKCPKACGELTDSLFWALEDGGLLRIVGGGPMPDFAAGKAPWATYGDKISSAEIGDSHVKADRVTAIGANAFTGLTNLRSVYLDPTLEKLGDNSFAGCTGLKVPVLPASLTVIGSGAFRDCTNLIAAVIPATVTSLGSGAYAGCENLTDISFLGNAPAIGQGAFEGDTLTASYLAANTTWTDAVKQSYGGNVTWMGVDQLDSGTCGDDILWILTAEGKLIISGTGPMYDWSSYEDFWFEYKSVIREVVIHEGVTTVGINVFKNCPNLVTVTLPEGLTAIGTSAFDGCASLESINIPASVQRIDTYAFSGCYELHTVRAVNLESWLGIDFGSEGNPMTHDAQLYFGDTLVTSVTVPASAGTVKNYAFYGCTSLKELKLEEGITAVGHRAFNRCPSLESITLPSTLTQAGEYAFSGCEKLRTVRAVSAESWLGIDFSNSETPLSNGADLYFGNTLVTSLTIPGSLGTVANNAFSGCTSLTQVTLEEGITAIGSSAFYGCGNLQTVTLPSSLSSLGTYCFYECEKLNNLVLPNALAEIPYYAFAYCRGLTDITIPGSVAEIGSNAFSGCTGLTKVTLQEGVTTVGYMSFSYCRGLKEIFLPSTLTVCEGTAFYNTDSIEKVYAASLESWLGIRFGDVLATPLSYGGDLYIGGTLLTDLVIPDTVTELKDYAFHCCYSLKSVTIPASVTTFGTEVFRGSALTSVTVQEGVTRIPENAFSDCSDLNQLIFLGDPPQIDGYAFDSYAQITAYYPADNANWTEDVMQNYGATITWVAGLPPVEEITVEDSVDSPTLDAVFGGEYATESTGEKTAAFTGLVPGEEYLLLCLASLEVEDLLAPGNLLYIDQGTALEDGTLSFRYIPRTAAGTCYVMACGPSGLDLSDAEVTFPIMGAEETPKAVDPQVVCDGKLLEEGRDYILRGDVTYQNQGEYVVTVLGIHNYSGSVVCTYTVLAECCPNNPETGAHNWAAASCTAPETCDYCGQTRGEALNHDYADGVCSVCGGADPDYVNPDETKPTDPAPTEPKPTDPPATEPDPTDPEVTEPKPTDPEPTEPDATEPKPTEPEVKVEGVTRLAGENRLVTSELIANQLKEKMGVEKFQNIIVASGGTFADALPGSYLSAVKNAPILLTLAKDKYVNQTAEYIKANLVSGGTVYILGGESAVPASMETALAGINVKRVAGADRFGTNLAILKEAGVKAGDEILVCTAKEFADSLSAAATGKPILLVYKKITDEQKAYLQTLSGNTFCVVGGTSAVPENLEEAMKAYGEVSRLAGKDRLDTSILVAEKYFPDATSSVVAFGWDFPDGLCGGSLAYATKSPLILAHSKEKLAQFTADYTTKAGLTAGYVLGGEGLVDDAATRAIFGVGSESINILK